MAQTTVDRLIHVLSITSISSLNTYFVFWSTLEVYIIVLGEPPSKLFKRLSLPVYSTRDSAICSMDINVPLISNLLQITQISILEERNH